LLSNHDFIDENSPDDPEEELNIEELLTCVDIEQTSFIKSSKKLITSMNSMITQIDDRLKFKKQPYGP